VTTYLLDTHVWLWAVREPHRLGAGTRALLETPETALALSSVSVWEASMLIARGRVSETADRVGRVQRWRRSVPALQVPIDDTIALRAGSLVWPHRDPADRYLVATALERGFTLLTADHTLLAYDEVRSLNALQ
jgi:PIN domain nuclease of toxin-antitoxin system